MAQTTDARSRLEALRKLLSEGELSTQDELRGELLRLKFDVTQSTISRDLRRLGAVKGIDPDGRTTYRLPDEVTAPVTTSSLRDLVTEIAHNGSIIVIHTTPGSASLVARHLDHYRPGGLLGTIAGDDTIFAAPASVRDIKATIRDIEDSFASA
jgi:transcriptional regulator of arginine metabolism